MNVVITLGDIRISADQFALMRAAFEAESTGAPLSDAEWEARTSFLNDLWDEMRRHYVAAMKDMLE